VIGPASPAHAPLTVEPDRWLQPVRRGVLIVGAALSLRWFLAVVWMGAVHLVLRGQAGDAGWLLLALQLGVDAVLALAAVAGAFLLTARAVPRVSTRRWPLRTLVVSDAAFSVARAGSFLAFGGFEGGALGSLLHVVAAVALLARLGELCDAGGEREAATWARTGAFGLVLVSFGVMVVALVPGGFVTGTLLLVWSLSFALLVVVTLFVSARAARWM